MGQVLQLILVQVLVHVEELVFLSLHIVVVESAGVSASPDHLLLLGLSISIGRFVSHIDALGGHLIF